LDKFIYDPTDVHRAIGHFVYEFSRLEDWLRIALQDILSIEPDAFSLISGGLDFAFLCNSTIAALKADPSRVKDADGLRKTIGRCLGINSERVRVVHGTWMAGSAYHTSRQTLANGEYFTEPSQLHKLADETVELRHAIQVHLKK
jgi:hypothetical protein